MPTLEKVRYSFSVEDAETSRNTGDETVFRVLVIKRAELEKISSLRWFPEIGLEKVYTQSCDYVKRELKDSNAIIEALIQALRCKPVRSLLSFERVLDYLELLILDGDQFKKYHRSPCEIIRQNVPILYAYRLTLTELEKMNWVITYTGELE